MKMFYKIRYNVVLMVVLALLMQVVGPVIGDYVYAGGETISLEDGDFSIEAKKTEGRLSVDWTYVYKPGEKLNYELNLGDIFERYEGKTEDLLADEEGKIGAYTISEDGKLTISIDEDIDEIVDGLLEESEDEGDATIPAQPVDPEGELGDPVERPGEGITGDDGDLNDAGVDSKTDGDDDSNQTQEGKDPADTDGDDSARIMENLLGLFSKNIVYAEGNDKKIEEYTFSGSFEIDGVVEESGAKTLNQEEYDNEVDSSVIKKITATSNGTNIKDIENYSPEVGDKVNLKIDFTLDVGHNYGMGSKLTYELPTPLKAVTGSGSLAKDGEEYGKYEIIDGKVIIEFNNKIRFQGAEGSGGLETIGEFSIVAEYSQGGEDNSLETELKLPGQETIRITFKPKGGTTITKEVDVKNGNNIDELTWTVIVNTEMKDLETGVEFKDSLSVGHTYKKDSLKVYKLNMGANGEVIGSEEDVSNNFTDKLNQDDLKEFSLNLAGKHAYKIVYKTILNDEKADDNGQLKVNNKAIFRNEEKSVQSTITYGKPLDKSVSKNGEKANWTITVNANKKKIGKNLKITDTWDENMKKYHELDGEIVVKDANANHLTKNTDYTITPTDGGGFELIFKNDIDDVHTIEYTTKPKDLITDGFTVENKVTRDDNKGGTQGDNQYYGQNVIKKTVSKPNYQVKTVKWTIEINNAKYEMKNLVLKDVFANKNLKISGDIEVKSNGQILDSSKYEIKHKNEDGTNASPNEPTKFGFDIKFKETVKEKITVTFTTDYDVKGVDNLSKYKNVGKITWGPDEDSTKYSSSDSAKVEINTQQKSKGYKTGSYNYETKKFKWSIGINYNFDAISNAVFSDELPESQVIDFDSITIYELDLSGGGKGKTTGSKLSKDSDYNLKFTGNNKFTIKFTNDDTNSINKPYRISYTSTIKDDYYKPGTKYSVKNEAKLRGDNDYSGGWDKTVTVEHSKDLILKEVKMTNPATAKLEWKLKLNYNQSTLDNVKITDVVGKDGEGNPNQKIYEDSFKIYPVTFSGNSFTPNIGSNPIDSSLYDLEVTEDGFTIEFKNEIKTAYLIKYETYFLGVPKDELKNEATLSYITKTKEEGSDESNHLTAKFNFSGSAFTKKGQLQITKVDSDDENIKLSGAEFELWSSKNNGFLIERVSEDEGGIYTFKTKVGQTKYWLKETKAPEGYVADEYKEGKEVEIKDEADPATSNYVEKIVIKNKKVHQAVKLIKVDEEDNNVKLLGAKFELYKSDGTKVTKDINGEPLDELITDKDGEVVVNNLAEGKYYFKEIEAPDNYILSENPNSDEFEIKKNQTVLSEVTMKNKRGKGKIKIIKVDEDNDNIKLENVEFKLTGTDGTEYLDKTSEDGTVVFEDLKYDKYSLVETKAPDGYTLVSKPIEIELDGETDNIDFQKTIKNTKKISVTATKQWIDGSTPRPTVWFKLYRSIGDSGIVEVEGIEIKELKDGTNSVTWENLDKVYKNGDDYTYSVKEVNEFGEDYTPDYYEKTENGLNVINYYVSPKNASVKATKIWLNGPNNKPTIWFKLYRMIQGGTKEEVPLTEAPIKELRNETLEVVWNQLTKTDSNGNKYIFSVEEVDREGNVYVPSRYRKSISDDGLTITNRYRPPVYPPTGPRDPDPTDPVVPPVDPEDPEPTDPIDPPVVDPEDPDPTDPIDPVDPEEPETPEEPLIPIVLDPPTKGTVTIDENGNWTYTPSPGATGKDSFIRVHPDGREELIEIDLDDLPLGTTSIKNGQPVLPKTGTSSNLGFYLSGLLLIGLGVFLRKRIV